MGDLEAAQQFQRVPEGVPVVEERAAAVFVRVGGDDGGLDLTAAADDLAVKRGRERVRKEFVRVFFEQLEEFRVAEDGGLDRFGEAVAEFLFGQRREGVWVDEHPAGLVERADEVLALGEVHRRLAADARVDGREQGGRQLDHPDAAQIDRRGEADEVAGDAAAQRGEDALAVEFQLRRAAAERYDGVDGLVLLPRGKDEGRDRGEELFRALAKELFHVGVADKELFARHGGGLRPRTCGYDDVVVTAFAVDVQFFHFISRVADREYPMPFCRSPPA